MASPSSPDPPRLVICDDHRMVADSFRRMLEPTYTVAGVVASGAELLAFLRATEVDIVLLDLALPDISGLELLKSVREVQPRLKILVFTMYQDRVLADACLHDGADGFVPKIAGMEELLDAIGRVLAGECYRSPRVPKSSHGVALAASHPGLWRLTPQEEKVFRLLGEGLRPCEIAARIGLSRNTVAFHEKRIMRHLGIATRAALVRFAILLGASGNEGKGHTPQADKSARESGGGAARRAEGYLRLGRRIGPALTECSLAGAFPVA
jgi:DNA-binding NarL/FixJ family response regulator